MFRALKVEKKSFMINDKLFDSYLIQLASYGCNA